jgi:hypothetical protein
VVYFACLVTRQQDMCSTADILVRMTGDSENCDYALYDTQRG